VTGGFFRAIETVDGIAGTLGEHVVYDVPLGEMQEYARRILEVDAESVRAFAASRLIPETFVVLVGDASRFAEDVQRAHGAARIIDARRLDLGSPSLGG
jgi:zinc protease